MKYAAYWDRKFINSTTELNSTLSNSGVEFWNLDVEFWNSNSTSKFQIRHLNSTESNLAPLSNLQIYGPNIEKISLQIFQVKMRSKGHYCNHQRDKHLSLKDKTVMVTVMPLIFFNRKLRLQEYPFTGQNSPYQRQFRVGTE